MNNENPTLTRISTMPDGRTIYAVNAPTEVSCAEVIKRFIDKRRLAQAKADAEHEGSNHNGKDT